MNRLHMTSNDWALYLQTFVPANDSEAMEYVNDLYESAKTDWQFQAPINARQMERVQTLFPHLSAEIETKLRYIKGKHRDDQYRIRSGFWRGGAK